MAEVWYSGQWPPTSTVLRRFGRWSKANAAGIWSANDAVRQAERELARQAEVAYARTVHDWHAAQATKVGASATLGRASNKPSKGKAARQTTSP
jgi:hypothetical protein